ncbi:MAG TPA: hypothetical protein VMW85_06405 [Methanomassiliicoccales archaeon]|nr:hypothetical protein [Methanomassiliicoccales archaeon]
MENAKVKLLAVVIVFLLIVSSGTLIWLMTPSKDSTLLGVAYADEPLVGATISVYDDDGDKVYEAKNATSSKGVFIEKVTWPWLKNVPSGFKITATGGTTNDVPFNGTLVRCVEDYEQTSSYAINVITTLVASYGDKNPTSTITQAGEAVHAFLEMPSELNITSIINCPSASTSLFSCQKFLEEADQNGSFNAYIDTLTAQIGDGQTHPFKGPSLSGGLAFEAFKFIFTNLAKGALSGIASKVTGTFMEPIMGWVMGVLGLGEEEQEDYTAEQLNALSDKLNQTYDKLVEMDKKLVEISNTLDQISASIAELKNALNTVNTELQLRMSQLSAYNALSKIDSSYTTLVTCAATTPGVVSQITINEWISGVTNPTSGIYNALDVLDKIVKGHVLGDEKGLLEVMVDNLIDQLYQQDPTGNSLYGRTYRDKVMSIYLSFEAYFERLLIYEVRGLTMIAEAHNARNESVLVQSYIDTYWKPMIQNQIDLFISQVERLVINAEPRAQLEFPNMGPIPATNYEITQNYWQSLYGHSMPSVAEILPRADHFADVLLNGTGKFVVRILVFPPTSNQNMTDPMPVFRNAESDDLITPVSVHKTVQKANTNFVYHLFTYDLGALPAGQYVLVSPTVTNAISPYTGWFSVDAAEQYEWWSYLAGLKMSTRLSVGTDISFITVTNDTYGNPYGYWGGIWAVENL